MGWYFTHGGTLTHRYYLLLLMCSTGFDVMRLRASAFTQEVFTINLGKAVTIMVNPDMAVHPSSAPSARYMLIFKKKTSKWCSVSCCNTFSITIALCNARYFVGNVSV
jgi:hypothetical protein